MRKHGKFRCVLLLAFIVPLRSLALVTFPASVCQLEGYLHQGMTPESWIFIINEGTDSETRFRLSGTESRMADRISGEPIRLTLEIPHRTESRYAEAKLLRIDASLNPYSTMKDYSSSSDLRDVCKNTEKRSQK